MEGSTTFELASGSPDSNFNASYQNGQRGYSAPAPGRSSSFREASDSRIIGSAKINSRVTASSSRDLHSLPQSLMLDPIVMGDPKYVRSGDLKRVFGFSAGNNSEDNSFGSVHLKNSSPVAVEELQRVRATVADNRIKASGRAKKLDEHLSKLNKYVEALPSKKQQQQQHRGDMLTSERSSSSNLKIGSQMHRNPPEPSQKFDDRAKNGVLNKRLRTSMAENRAEGRNGGVPRQPLMVTKDREMIKDNVDPDLAEEKLRRLPAGGEGWDKKMKRKRSVGAAFPRPINNEGEIKRTVLSKHSNETGSQSSDSALVFRSGAGGNNKLDPLASSAGSAARVTLKNDQERAMPSRDLSSGQMKERSVGKVNVKLNNREDNQEVCPSPIVKGKASRGPRSGSIAAANLSANVPRLSGTLESWEQPHAPNKVSPIIGVNNRKRGIPSSPPFTQWGGQRPQKISRTRRTNLAPVSSHDEIPMQSEGCSPSDFGPRISIAVGNNVSLFSKGGNTTNPNFKLKHENFSSPARRSDSEESGAGETRISDKCSGGRDLEDRSANCGISFVPTSVSIRQNAVIVKEEVGDGVKRQGRSGRVSPFPRTSISPSGEKLDNVVSHKPLRNSKSGADKAGSKSGRPLKKLSDRKSFSRLGHLANGGSPDYSGESDDDREELLSAAHLACNFSLDACSNSTIWKAAESFFAPLGQDDRTYLSEQLKVSEEPDTCFPQHFNNGAGIEAKLQENCVPDGLKASTTSGRDRRMHNESGLKDSSHQMDSFFGCPTAGRRCDVTPLYQRVLSALIVEDEIEECEDTGFGRSRSLVSEPNMFAVGDSKYIDGPDFSEDARVIQTPINGNARKVFPCNGSMAIGRNPVVQDHIVNGELMRTDDGCAHSDVDLLVRLSRCDYNPRNFLARNGGISSTIGFQYEQMRIEDKLMLELQSIGLFVGTIPGLEDKEEEIVSQEISQLERQLHEQIGKKTACLARVNSAVQAGNHARRDPEEVAMDKLIELTFRKLMSTRGSLAAKYGVTKVKKQFALALVRRMLARCRKFEYTGASCFSETGLREIIYALPPRLTESGSFWDMLENKASLLNKGKKKELLLDDVGGAAAAARVSSLGMMMGGGAKGKRSEREGSNKNKGGRAPSYVSGSKGGERRTKTKPKQQRTAQLPSSGNAFHHPKFGDAAPAAAAAGGNNSVGYPSGSGGSVESGSHNNGGGSSKRKDVRFMSGNTPVSVSSSSAAREVKESLDFGSLPMGDDLAAELGVDSELGGVAPQDFSAWFNFDVDGLQDHDSVGLEIPMDDLADLNMF